MFKKAARWWLEILTGACLLMVVVMVFLQVVFRFVIKIPAPWTEELARLAFVYMAFFGIVLGAKYNMHLSVDILEKVPKKWKAVILTASYVASIAFMGVFTWYGWVHALNSQVQRTPTLEISYLYIYLILPFTGILTIFYLLKSLIAVWRHKDVEDR